MPTYNKFFFRAPDVSTFLADVEQICSENGIDPFEKGILQKDESGNVEAGFGVHVIPSSHWYITEPTFNNDGTEKTAGDLGDYALFNVLTKDEELIALAGAFTKTDPALSPSEVPSDEQIGRGTHRIDESMVTDPVRTG